MTNQFNVYVQWQQNNYRLGLNNLLREVIDEEDNSTNENGDKSSEAKNDDDDDDSDEDYDRKSDNAVDYSDINELAEDIQTSMPVWTFWDK